MAGTKNCGLVAITLVLMLSCEKEDAAPEFRDQPVLEAYLVAGEKMEVKVSRQIAFDQAAEYSTEVLSGLDLSVSLDGVVHSLEPDMEEEETYYSPDLLMRSGDVYDLSFEYNDLTVTATTVIPEKPVDFLASPTSIEFAQLDPSGGGFGGFEQPDPIQLTWENTDGAYHIIVVENVETDPEPTVVFDDDDERPERIFRNEPTQESALELRRQSFSYFGTHRVILYHINADYASLYDDEGSTSQNLGTPNTGIENGVGIFTGMNADTLIIEVKQE